MKLPLWQPSEERKKKANITRFITLVNGRYGTKIASYDELHEWSIHNLADFWALIWDFCEAKASKPYDSVITLAQRMMDIKWFQGAHLNFAQNLLRYRDNRTALIFKSEARKAARMTYAELYEQVARLAKPLREWGVKPSDRVGRIHA